MRRLARRIGLGFQSDMYLRASIRSVMTFTHEQMLVESDACKIVNAGKTGEHHICAVGVSTLRATETAVGTDGMLKEFDGWTNKFIFPPYEFGLADSMIANFYHPESTMMMATAAFGGYDLIYKAYELAVENGLKFGCYGDAMLILDD